MFWVRMDALAPLLDAHLAECEFEAESGQLDGTFAHAVERVFGLAAMARGARIEEVASACGGARGSSCDGYRYARPS